MPDTCDGLILLLALSRIEPEANFLQLPIDLLPPSRLIKDRDAAYLLGGKDRLSRYLFDGNQPPSIGRQLLIVNVNKFARFVRVRPDNRMHGLAEKS